MIGGNRIVAVITARGGSKGLPGKNLRPMLGKPLVGWTIEQALACGGAFDAIIVTTDDPAIAAAAQRFGAEVPFLRPPHLATDEASSIDVVLHALNSLSGAGRPFDIVVLLEPTSPLREPSDIVGGLELLVGAPDIDSVVSVARAESLHPAFLYRIEAGLLRPHTGQQPTGLRRQDLAPLYFLDGSLYVSRVPALRERRSFYHARTAPWPVARYKSHEVDELSDFIAVEALLAARHEGRL